MKIEIGDYIRTKQGTIGQIIEKYEKYCVIANRRGEIDVLYENIAKHSKNIIDLIEVNDIVTYWIDTQSYNGWVQNFVDKELLKDMKKNFIEEDIKSIVTHEQIKDMEYRL